MAFTTVYRVRFGDEDHAQIVYYPRFFHIFHTAFEDFFDQQGFPYRGCLDEGVGWPAVHAEADYLRQVRFGDELVIAVSLEKIGRSSSTFRYVATLRRRGVDDDGPAVTAKIVVACIDMKTMRSQEIPAKYRALFEPHLSPRDPTSPRDPVT